MIKLLKGLKIKKRSFKILLSTLVVTSSVLPVYQSNHHVQAATEIDKYGQGYDLVGGLKQYKFTSSVDFKVPTNGDVKIEAYGAPGAYGGPTYGNGAYAYGTLKNAKDGEVLKINTGGIYGAASDVRRNGNTLNDRIIVAGGGGSTPYIPNNNAPNYVNIRPGANSGTASSGASPGTQTQGGYGSGGSGSFGSRGGNGGDGWYGGGGGSCYSDTINGSRYNYCDGGAGGSSYTGTLANAGVVEGQSKGATYILITVLNSAPSITLTSKNNQVTSEKDTFNKLNIKGTIQDPDIGDTNSVKFSIDSTSFINKTLKSVTADSTNLSIDESLTIDNSFSEGVYTLRIWGEDDKGGKSSEIVQVFKVDKTAPVITVNGLLEGATYVNEVLPTIDVTDSSQKTMEVLLDRKEWNGEVIRGSGNHTLEIDVIDEVGNTSSKTINFKINNTPVVVKSESDKNIHKYDEVSIDGSDLFSDEEGDAITYNAVSDNPLITSASISGSQITLKALKQGVAKITIKVNDGYSTSNEIQFTVNVDTRPPQISFKNPKYIIVDDSRTFDIEGSVKDTDKEHVKLNASLNGVNDVYDIAQTTGGNDDWTLQWEPNLLPIGVYDSINVQAEDDFGGKDIKTYPYPIIKVPEVSRYEYILNYYSMDLRKNIEDFTIEEHKTLLEAYVAILELDVNNKPSNLVVADNKVNKLIDGKIKDQFNKTIKTKAFEYLVNHFFIATKSDYELSGISNVIDNNVTIYNNKGEVYVADLSVSSKTVSVAEVQKVIELVNALENAKLLNTIDSWKDAKEFILELEDGQLKDESMDTYVKGIISSLTVDSTQLKAKILTDELGITANEVNEEDYKKYLSDFINSKGSITLEDLQKIVSEVDKVISSLSNAMNNPSKNNLETYLEDVNNLKDGLFKTNLVNGNNDVALHYLVTNPTLQDEEDLTRLGIIYEPNNLSEYQSNLDTYIKDIGQEYFTIKLVQNVINATDSLLIAIANPTTDNVKKALDDIAKLQDNSSFKDSLMSELSKKVLEYINDNLNSINANDLKNLGINNIIDANITQYQDALAKYQDDIKKELNLDDIQKVIDAINAVEKAKVDISRDSILNAIDKINELSEGNLKDLLKDIIREIATDFIIQHTDDIELQDLYRAGIVNLIDKNFEDYKNNLKKDTPLTKVEIQNVVETTNQLLIALINLSEDDLMLLKDLIDSLNSSVLKTDLHLILGSLESMLDFEQVMSDDNKLKMESSIQQVTANTKSYLEIMGEALALVRIASKGPTDEKVDIAIASISKLDKGKLKDRLLENVGKTWLNHVIKNPSIATLDELTKAGFQDLNKDLLEQYQKGFQELTDELKKDLTREQIQLIIDIVNAMDKANKSQNMSDVDSALKLIDKMADSKLKDEYRSNMNNLKQALTPKPVKPTKPNQPNMLQISEDDVQMSVLFQTVKPTVKKDMDLAIEVSTVTELKNATIYLYSDQQASQTVAAKTMSVKSMSGKTMNGSTTSLMNIPLGTGQISESLATIKVGNVKPGETKKINYSLQFKKTGTYKIKAVFVDEYKNYSSDNVIELKVNAIPNITIPNVQLPNKTGLAVAKLTTISVQSIFKKESNGEMKKVGTLKKGTTVNVYDTFENYYKLSGNQYLEKTNQTKVYIGQVTFKQKLKLYNSKGKVIGTLDPKKSYKVYSFDTKRYFVDGGYILKQKDTLFKIGKIVLVKNTYIVDNKGRRITGIKKGKQFDAYGINGNLINIGNGKYIKVDGSIRYTKN